jgi:flavin-dependent dehydrogenase
MIEVPHWDVAIVGAGPSGCAAAIGCAAGGARVALIERDEFPRDRPGETLHPGAEPLLTQLGVAEQVRARDFPRHTGTWVTWAGPRRFVPFGADQHGAWRGFQVWRADFDALLLDRARGLGVTVLQPRHGLSPLFESGRVAGVRTEQGPVRASVVVDAAGSRHWLARHLGLAVVRHSSRLIARYGYLAGPPGPTDAAPSIVADANGWTWTARVCPGLYQWTRLSLAAGGATPSRVPPELDGCQPRGRVRGADVTWRIAALTAGPGYFLCGDAAAVVDPAASHGVLKAIMSGILAAHAVATVRGGRLDPRLAAADYDAFIRGWFLHDVRRLRELYQVFCAAPA